MTQRDRAGLIARTALGVAAMCGALFATPLAAADASPAAPSSGFPSFCISGNVCTWNQPEGDGCQMNWKTPDTNFDNNHYEGGGSGCTSTPVNDSTESIWNDSSYNVCFYLDSNYRRYGQKIAAHKTASQVAYPDQYSSWKRC